MNTMTKRIIGGTVLAGLLGTGLAVAGPAAMSDAAVPLQTVNLYSWAGATTAKIGASSVSLPSGSASMDTKVVVEQNGKVVSRGSSYVAKPGTYTVTTIVTHDLKSIYGHHFYYNSLDGNWNCTALRTWSDNKVDAVCKSLAPVYWTPGFASSITFGDSHAYVTVANTGNYRAGQTFVLDGTATQTMFVGAFYRPRLFESVMLDSKQIVTKRIVNVRYINQNAVPITNTMRSKVVFGSSKNIADKEFHQIGSFYKKVGNTTIYKWKDFSKDPKTGAWQVKSSTQIGYINGKAVWFTRGMPA